MKKTKTPQSMKTRHLFVMAIGLTVMGGTLASTLSGPSGGRIEASIQNLSQRSAATSHASAQKSPNFEPRPTQRVQNAVSSVGTLGFNQSFARFRSDFNLNDPIPYTGSSEPYQTMFEGTYLVGSSVTQASATITLPRYHGCLGTLHWSGVEYVTVQSSEDGGTSWSAYDSSQYCQQATHLKFLFNNQKFEQQLRVGVHMQSSEFNGAETCFTSSMDAYNAQYLTDTTCVTPALSNVIVDASKE